MTTKEIRRDVGTRLLWRFIRTEKQNKCRKKENDTKKKPNLLQLKPGDLEHPSSMGQERLSEGMMRGPSTKPLIIAGHGLDDMPDPPGQERLEYP
jgi:hypothetical protein